MKRVLIITYYWPPAGGAGVQRVLKFTKYLPRFNWQPIVLTVPNPDAPVEDFSLQKDIPEICKVYKIKGFEPFALYKKFTGKKSDEKIPSDILVKKNQSLKEKISKFVRANFFIPDAKIGWLKNAVRQGEKIIKDEKIDIIFASAPPPTAAMIGAKLAEKTGIKFVADFRDPWLEIVYNQKLKRSRLTKFIDSKLELRTLKQADKIVTISEDISQLLKSKVPSKDVVVIPNGFDESDFHAITTEKNKSLTIAYTGSMSVDRIPSPLMYALKKFKENGVTNIRLNFAGRFAPEFYSLMKELEIEEFFHIQSFVPHNESTKILQTADVLLLVIDNVPNNKGFLTGKIFEYLGTRKPIFAIGPVNGDADKILTETNSGEMVNYSDNDKAYELLQKYYDDWKNENIRFSFNVGKFSRENNTKELAKLMDSLI